MIDSMLLGAINWHSTFFYLAAITACVFGAGVLFSSNVVRMAFYLVISLASTAGLFFLAGAEFLGAMQIMIYVGGTLVLLVFGVMLTAQDAFVNLKTRGGEWVLGVSVGACLLTLLVVTAFKVKEWHTPHEAWSAHQKQVQAAEKGQIGWKEVGSPDLPSQQTNTSQIGVAFTGGRIDGDRVATVPVEEPDTDDKKAVELAKAKRLAGIERVKRLRQGQSGYLLPFQAVGIHLLIVLVGAAYLSRTKKFLGPRARAMASYEPRDRRRSMLLSVLLVSGEVGNLILAVATIAGQASFQDDYPELLVSPPSWLFPIVSLLFLVNVLGFAIVWGWQRWGLILLAIVPIVQGVLLATNGLYSPIAAAVAIGQLVLVAILAGVIFTGRPSAWSQMD